MPLLSIVVPTADRPHTALPSVTELTKIPGDIEIVVADCSREPELGQPLAALGDPRLTYRHGPPCTMTENWNRAIGAARGDYVTFIGDDDAFLPSGVGLVAALADAGGFEALAYPFRATYYWDDFPDRARAGTLHLATVDAPPIVVDTRANAHAMMRHRPARMPPAIYHGIVSRAVLLGIEGRFGALFRAVAPDTYLTGLMNGIVRRHVVMPVALSFMGKSGKSNSGRIVARTVETHRDAYAEEERRWDPIVPPMNTIETYVADSLARAYRDLGDADLLAAFRRHYMGGLYAETMLRNPREVGAIAGHLLGSARTAANGMVHPGFASAFARRTVSRIGRRLRRGPRSGRTTEPCPSLAAAIARTEAFQAGFVLPAGFPGAVAAGAA